ncbi:MAG: DUF4143 domain-containing protein [bacterium]
MVWLAGVRPAGKTVLCQSLPDVEYFDCELPRIRRLLQGPEDLLKGLRGRRVVLDEVHRLPDPSAVLKATGSSTLGASAKFRDTLAGRRAVVWLTPLMSEDLVDFGSEDLIRRLRHGGLPAFFLSATVPRAGLPGLDGRLLGEGSTGALPAGAPGSFLQFVELLLARSGSLFEASRYARECGVSHTTIRNYLAVLEATYVAHRIRPFSRRAATEIVAAPKVYGFVAFRRRYPAGATS